MPLPSVVAAAARYPAFGAQVPQTFMQSRDAPTGQSVCPARDSAIVRQPGAAAARCHDWSVGLPRAGSTMVRQPGVAVRQPGAAAARSHDWSVGLPRAGSTMVRQSGAAAARCHDR